jgi:hypothetical protein
LEITLDSGGDAWTWRCPLADELADAIGIADRTATELCG